MAIAKTIKSWLSDNHIEFDLVPHYKTHSSHDTARAAHIMDDHIAKAVLLKDDKGFALAVIPASDWLKLLSLRNAAGRQFELASESEVTNVFDDCKPGAIPPIGPAYGLETYLDESLMSLANVYFEAGDHRNLVHVNGEEFHYLLKGVRCGHFSHNDQ